MKYLSILTSTTLKLIVSPENRLSSLIWTPHHESSKIIYTSFEGIDA